MARALLTYWQIADDLQQRISAQALRPSEKIPSYRALATAYGVSVSTAQRAVSLLRDRGVVTGVAGRGVFVAAPGADEPLSAPGLAPRPRGSVGPS